jgi:hypothetical protein
MQKIRFKQGSSVIDGAMHTFVHVRSDEKFKHFLDLKYTKTMCSWDSCDVAHMHKIDVDIDDVCADLAEMSVKDLKMTFKCSQSHVGKFAHLSEDFEVISAPRHVSHPC